MFGALILNRKGIKTESEFQFPPEKTRQVNYKA